MEDNNKKDYNSFDDMEFLSYELLKGIFDYGFSIPSRIQKLTIKEIYEGHDLIAQSQSGTGKTGAFTIGSLSILNPKENFPQIMVLATTRELATQIHTNFINIAKYMEINIELCIGGTKVKNYKHIRTSHVLVGTPGRILDYISSKVFDPKKLKLFVMDEADALLKEDFLEQVKSIITSIDAHTQIAIYSATYPREILKMAESIMTEPKLVLLDREDITLDAIKQYKINTKFEEYKFETLLDLYKNLLIGQSIIFTNSIASADELTRKLEENGNIVNKIHGEMDTTHRTSVLRDFRNGLIRILIATDVLSRGIDVEQIGIVINYDMPRDKASYIHRIGRSGRFGKIGVAINFITDKDYRTLNDIERVYNIKIQDMPDFQTVLSLLSGLKGYGKIN